MKGGVEEWCQKDNPDNARHMFNAMKDWRKMYPANTEMAVLLGGAASTLILAFAKHGRMEEVNAIFQEMNEQRIHLVH
jgi:pentatricopeptide repeat protein